MPFYNMQGDAMKRYRLSTFMLLIVIAALSVALVVQNRRYARRESELLARLAQAVKQQQETDEIRRLIPAFLANTKKSIEATDRFITHNEKAIRQLETLIPDVRGDGEPKNE
jgi:hypothetical protein